MIKPGSVRQNLVLGSLPAADARHLGTSLKRVQLSRHSVLHEPGKPIKSIYFPEDAIISFLADTGESGRIEVWSVGAEGLAGACAVLGQPSPYRATVLYSGQAWVADAAVVRQHFRQRGNFQDVLLKYYDRLLVQVAQTGVCNAAHEVEQRFCRWLLTMQNRTGSRILPFTQDFIAAVLGTRRATISVAAAALQDQGVISYAPGSITIRSRRGLLAASCTCYKRLIV